jgi:alpha-1,2-mannosyltransferase
VKHLHLVLWGVVVAVAAFLLYWILWPSVGAFVTGVDHCDLLFCDFVRFYYPMSQRILEPGVDHPMVGYYYSAFFAIALSPLGALGLDQAVAAWGAIQALAIAALIWLQWDAIPRRDPRLILLSLALTLTSIPVIHNFKWGQISVLIVVLVLAAAKAHRQGLSLLAGAVLGLAVCLKYYPAVFALYFLVKRDFRALAAFAVVAALLYVAGPAALMGPADWYHFERAVQAAVAGTNWTFDPNSQYLASVLRRLLGLGARSAIPTVAVWIGAAVGLASAVILWRRSKTVERAGPLASLGLLFLATPFVVETSWPHYFAFLPLCQLAAVEARRDVAGPRWIEAAWVAAAGLSIALSNLLLYALFSTWRSYSGSSCVFYADLVLFVLAIVAAVRSKPAESERSRRVGRKKKKRS